jgi:hypothetical protein
MTERDPRVATLLNNVLPIGDEREDWQRIVGDATRHSEQLRRRSLRWSTRRLGLVLAVTAAVGVLSAIPALAVENGWWFLDNGQLTPATPVAIVTSGGAVDEAWHLVAFVSDPHGICVGVTSDGSKTQGALACGMPIRGAPGAASVAPAKLHWVGYGRTSFPTSRAVSTFVFGPTADGVARVEAELANGDILSAETIAAPLELKLSLRFYVIELPPTVEVRSLLARDVAGTILERFPIRNSVRTP